MDPTEGIIVISSDSENDETAEENESRIEESAVEETGGEEDVISISSEKDQDEGECEGETEEWENYEEWSQESECGSWSEDVSSEDGETEENWESGLPGMSEGSDEVFLPAERILWHQPERGIKRKREDTDSDSDWLPISRSHRRVCPPKR